MTLELNKIYQGDCLEIMKQWPDKCVLITDPPYGINLKTDYKNRGRENLAKCNNYPPVFGDDKPFNPEPFLKANRVCLFGANYFADKLPPTSSWIVWDKRDGTCVNDQADCELAWTNFGGPCRIYRHLWNGMLKDSEQTEKRVHPTQKPIALFQWIIDRFTEKWDLIIDPFAGSGSCLVAAEILGRQWIGCEISADYCRIAQERVDRERAQLKMDLK